MDGSIHFWELPNFQLIKANNINFHDRQPVKKIIYLNKILISAHYNLVNLWLIEGEAKTIKNISKIQIN